MSDQLRVVRRYGRKPTFLAQIATVVAGTHAAFLPGDGEPNDLSDLVAMTSRTTTIRPIVERGWSSYCESRDHLLIVARHCELQQKESKRIQIESKRIHLNAGSR